MKIQFAFLIMTLVSQVANARVTDGSDPLCPNLWAVKIECKNGLEGIVSRYAVCVAPTVSPASNFNTPDPRDPTILDDVRLPRYMTLVVEQNGKKTHYDIDTYFKTKGVNVPHFNVITPGSKNVAIRWSNRSMGGSFFSTLDYRNGRLPYKNEFFHANNCTIDDEYNRISN